MSVVGNGVRLSASNPMRQMSAASAGNETLFHGIPLTIRKSQAQAFSSYAAQPRGGYPPYCWIMPRSARDLVSRNLCYTTATATASGAMGAPVSATAGAIIYGAATGYRVIYASGLSGESIGASALLVGLAHGAGIGPALVSAEGSLVASIGGEGASVVTIDGAAEVVGIFNGNGTSTISFAALAELMALLYGSGLSPVTIAGMATLMARLHASGSSALVLSGSAAKNALGWMDAAVQLSLGGSLVPYAHGWMSGTTEDLSVLTAEQCATAVWESLAASFNTPGTMGAKLNAAGTAGDPWTADLEGYPEGQAGYQLANVAQAILDATDGVESATTVREALRLLLAVAVGKDTITTGPTSTIVKFRDINDTKDRVTATMNGSVRVGVVTNKT
jgi:hypothetical protein